MAWPFFPLTVLAHPPLKVNVMRIECEAGAKMQVEGLRYVVLVDSEKIEKFVVSTCEEEWDNEDFETFGDDLYGQTWKLSEVLVKNIQVQKQLLQSPIFIKDVTPRIAKQRELYEEGIAIPPLILRGKDLLIFDGYARWHFFRSLGLNKCLAYTSSA